MKHGNFVKMPILGELRAALQYVPDNRQKPLKCITDFEKHRAGERLGIRIGDIWLAQIGTGTTYLANVVWRVVEGSIPAGFKVQQIDATDDNRITNLHLVNRHGEVRRPKSVPALGSTHCGSIGAVSADSRPQFVTGASGVDCYSCERPRA